MSGIIRSFRGVGGIIPTIIGQGLFQRPVATPRLPSALAQMPKSITTALGANPLGIPPRIPAMPSFQAQKVGMQAVAQATADGKLLNSQVELPVPEQIQEYSFLPTKEEIKKLPQSPTGDKLSKAHNFLNAMNEVVETVNNSKYPSGLSYRFNSILDKYGVVPLSVGDDMMLITKDDKGEFKISYSDGQTGETQDATIKTIKPLGYFSGTTPKKEIFNTFQNFIAEARKVEANKAGESEQPVRNFEEICSGSFEVTQRKAKETENKLTAFQTAFEDFTGITHSLDDKGVADVTKTVTDLLTQFDKEKNAIERAKVENTFPDELAKDEPVLMHDKISSLKASSQATLKSDLEKHGMAFIKLDKGTLFFTNVNGEHKIGFLDENNKLDTATLHKVEPSFMDYLKSPSVKLAALGFASAIPHLFIPTPLASIVSMAILGVGTGFMPAQYKPLTLGLTATMPYLFAPSPVASMLSAAVGGLSLHNMLPKFSDMLNPKKFFDNIWNNTTSLFKANDSVENNLNLLLKEIKNFGSKEDLSSFLNNVQNKYGLETANFVHDSKPTKLETKDDALGNSHTALRHILGLETSPEKIQEIRDDAFARVKAAQESRKENNENLEQALESANIALSNTGASEAFSLGQILDNIRIAQAPKEQKSFMQTVMNGTRKGLETVTGSLWSALGYKTDTDTIPQEDLVIAEIVDPAIIGANKKTGFYVSQVEENKYKIHIPYINNDGKLEVKESTISTDNPNKIKNMFSNLEDFLAVPKNDNGNPLDKIKEFFDAEGIGTDFVNSNFETPDESFKLEEQGSAILSALASLKVGKNEFSPLADLYKDFPARVETKADREGKKPTQDGLRIVEPIPMEEEATMGETSKPQAPPTTQQVSVPQAVRNFLQRKQPPQQQGSSSLGSFIPSFASGLWGGLAKPADVAMGRNVPNNSRVLFDFDGLD